MCSKNLLAFNFLINSLRHRKYGARGGIHEFFVSKTRTSEVRVRDFDTNNERIGFKMEKCSQEMSQLSLSLSCWMRHPVIFLLLPRLLVGCRPLKLN